MCPLRMGHGQLSRHAQIFHRFDFEPGEACVAVGIPSVRKFSRYFKKWSGECPSQVQGRKLPPIAGYSTYHDLCRGTLPYPEGRRLLEQLEQAVDPVHAVLSFM